MLPDNLMNEECPSFPSATSTRTKSHRFLATRNASLNNQHTHSKLLSKFIITLSMSKDDLTPKMNEVLKGAQVRIPGEKTFMWRGKSPFIIMVKSTTPTPVGHWTSQVRVWLVTSGLSACVRMNPFIRCTVLGKTVSLNFERRCGVGS